MGKNYRNVRKTKQAIRAAFLELIAEKHAIDRISVSDVCARADIAKSTFYYHYDDLYAVPTEFATELLERLSDAVVQAKSSPDVNYRMLFRQVVQYLKENEQAYRRLVHVLDNDSTFIENFKRILTKDVLLHGDRFPLSADPAVQLVQVRFLTNAVVDTFVDCFRGTLDVQLEEVGEILLDMLLHLAR